MPTLKVLGRHLDKTWRCYRPFVSPSFRTAYRELIAHQQPLPKVGKKVLFNLTSTRVDGPQGRRFYNLHTFFRRAGYHPVFVNHFGFLANPKRNFKSHSFEHSFSLIEPGELLPGDPKDWVIVTEQDQLPSAMANPMTPVFKLSLEVNEQVAGNEFAWPFPLFPGVYQRNQDLELGPLQQQPRHWQGFFGGQAAAHKYNTDWVRSVYGKVPRQRYLDICRQTLLSKQAAVVAPGSSEELNELTHQNVSGAVFVYNEVCKIAVDQWLPTLAQARFFFACPGVRYPMSHNAIEALAVGTVPIIEYPEDFYPPLEDGVNCISFSGEAGLVSAIERMLAMPEQQWQAISANAIDYYNRHLEPSAVVENLLQAYQASNVDTIKLVPFLKCGGGHI